MLSAQQKVFVTEYYPWAVQASKQTNVPVPVILGQWINETGAGTSSAFVTKNNFAGVMSGGVPKTYASKAEGLAGYIRTMNLSYYKEVRAAGSTQKAAEALVKSKWEATGYQGGKGIYPIITDVSTFLNGGVATPGGRVSSVSRYSGGLADGLDSVGSALNGIQAGQTLTETSAGEVAPKVVMFGVIAVVALILTIVIIRSVVGSKTVKAVVSKGALK